MTGCYAHSKKKRSRKSHKERGGSALPAIYFIPHLPAPLLWLKLRQVCYCKTSKQWRIFANRDFPRTPGFLSMSKNANYLTFPKHLSQESTALAMDLCRTPVLIIFWKSSSKVCITYCKKRIRPGIISSCGCQTILKTIMNHISVPLQSNCSAHLVEGAPK